METFSVHKEYPEMPLFFSQYPVGKCIDWLTSKLVACNFWNISSVMMTSFSFAYQVFKGIAKYKTKILSKADQINQPHCLNLDNKGKLKSKSLLSSKISANGNKLPFG